MVVKRLIRHGNSRALVIDRSVLQAAGLGEDTLFQVVADPNSGITIQSVKPVNEKLFHDSLGKVLKKHDKLFNRLSKR